MIMNKIKGAASDDSGAVSQDGLMSLLGGGGGGVLGAITGALGGGADAAGGALSSITGALTGGAKDAGEKGGDLADDLKDKAIDMLKDKLGGLFGK
jgi:hypothetical protein